MPQLHGAYAVHEREASLKLRAEEMCASWVFRSALGAASETKWYL